MSRGAAILFTALRAELEKLLFSAGAPSSHCPGRELHRGQTYGEWFWCYNWAQTQWWKGDTWQHLRKTCDITHIILNWMWIGPLWFDAIFQAKHLKGVLLLRLAWLNLLMLINFGSNCHNHTKSSDHNLYRHHHLHLKISTSAFWRDDCDQVFYCDMLQALLFNHIWGNNKNTEQKSEVQSEQQITAQHNSRRK